MMTLRLIGLLALLQAGGVGNLEDSGRPWELRTYGSLRAIFHEDQLGPEVELDRVLPNTALYAVGARSDLAGEITVIAGVAYVSLATGSDSSSTQVWREGPESACLLVTAEVEAWQELSLDRSVPSEALDRLISEMADSAGIDVAEAFPFVIEGVVQDLSWHVIDGSRLPGGGASHEAHREAAVLHHRAETAATLIGFYSPRDHGVFTHRESNTHIHCVVGEPLSSGHVDQVVLTAATKIRIPLAGSD
jgi:acetolactate decarboxylase